MNWYALCKVVTVALTVIVTIDNYYTNVLMYVVLTDGSGLNAIRKVKVIDEIYF